MKAKEAYRLARLSSVDLANDILDVVYRNIEKAARQGRTGASLYDLCGSNHTMYGDIVYDRCLSQLNDDGYSVQRSGSHPAHTYVYWHTPKEATSDAISDLSVDS